MGYHRHDAITATSWNEDHLKIAHEKARELCLPVSKITPGATNGYVSFLIAPDGSKEGWPDSDKMDDVRDRWKDHMRGLDSVWVDWAHVSFGGDEDKYSHLADHSGNAEMCGSRDEDSHNRFVKTEGGK